MKVCEAVSTALTTSWVEQVECVTVGKEAVHVTLPLHYPDGDLIEMLISPAGNQLMVSDYGQANQRLSSLGIAVGGDAHDGRVRQICRPLGLEYVDLELLTLVDASLIGAGIHSVASAMLQVDAMSVLARPIGHSFGTELTAWLAKQTGITTARSPNVAGSSGKRYALTAEVSTLKSPDQLFLLQAVGGASSRNTRSIDHAFRVVHDLSAIPESNKIVVLAEPPSSYDISDLRLFQNDAMIASWAFRDKLLEYVTKVRKKAESSFLFPTQSTLM